MTPKIHIIDITNNEGIPFRAKLTVDPEPGKTKISFYDRRYDHTPDGQFTGGQYYANDIAQIPYGRGLNLHGGVSAWTIDGPTFTTVRDWLNRQIDVGVWMV